MPQPVVQRAARCSGARLACSSPARPEPRKIVPQPRSAPPIILHRPRLPPSLRGRRRRGSRQGSRGRSRGTRPVVVVAPPPGRVVVKPPAAREEPQRLPRSRLRRKPTPAAVAAAHSQAAVAPATVAENRLQSRRAGRPRLPTPHLQFRRRTDTNSGHRPSRRVHCRDRSTPNASGTAAPPARRMVMPQTGPRPVYKASILPASSAGRNLDQAREFSVASRSSIAGQQRAPGSYRQRTPGASLRGNLPADRGPSIPRAPEPGGSRLGPAGPGGRPGFGARPGFGGRRVPALALVQVPGGAPPPGGSSPAARSFAWPRQGPAAISEDQRRPDEGLCAASSLWRHAVQQASQCRSRAKSR